MSVNINTNYNQSFNLNVLKNNTASSSNFAEILNQNIHSTGQSINTQYFGNVSKNEFEDSIKNLLKKMDEVIEAARKYGDDKLTSELSDLKQHFQAQVEIYNLTLNIAEKATEGLNTSNPKELAENAKELNNDMFLQYSFGYGIAEQAKNFFQTAGITDNSVQASIEKITTYIENTRDKVELDNGKVVRSGSAITKDLHSKYLSYIEFNSNDKLLESLLQISNRSEF